MHADYPVPPTGRSTAPGEIEVNFNDRRGRVIGHQSRAPRLGITEFGFIRGGYRADIAGVTIVNTDPGGIAFDDILFQIAPLG